jgi:hypothetical protein
MLNNYTILRLKRKPFKSINNLLSIIENSEKEIPVYYYNQVEHGIMENTVPVSGTVIGTVTDLKQSMLGISACVSFFQSDAIKKTLLNDHNGSVLYSVRLSDTLRTYPEANFLDRILYVKFCPVEYFRK